jgi:hypothetical protein
MTEKGGYSFEAHPSVYGLGGVGYLYWIQNSPW